MDCIYAASEKDYDKNNYVLKVFISDIILSFDNAIVFFPKYLLIKNTKDSIKIR